MVKPVSRSYSQYSLNALELLGQLVREARLSKAMTTTDLALRAGISRALLQRIERGDPGCAIGMVFEIAAICGVPLLIWSRVSSAITWGYIAKKWPCCPKPSEPATRS